MKSPLSRKIGIIGGGRVGSSLGRALQNAGFTISGISGSSAESKARIKKLLPGIKPSPPLAVAKGADILILSVPDDHLEELIGELEEAGGFHRGQHVIHTSGSKGLSVFAGVDTKIRKMAVHPAMSFTGSRYDVRRLKGATYGVTVDGPQALALAEKLVLALAGSIVILTEEQRVIYHAALTLSSNYLVTLASQSAELLESVGIENPEKILNPLLTATLGNTMFRGADALSGPISRGDSSVVAGHRKALGDSGHQRELNVYDSLGVETAKMARSIGRISEEKEAELLAILRSEDSP